jgi:cytoplasmic iron level regulating protein YaaA (DUF328/UPF0246 family)
MQILLANAKIMFETTAFNAESHPKFQEIADKIAGEMSRMDVDMLAKTLKCNRQIAAETAYRYAHFTETPQLPALYAYNGQAYKHLRAESLSADVVAYAQQHLLITCFLYGLLRPLDGIVPYRMEPSVKLDYTDDKPIGSIWKKYLTDFLIEAVKADDGLLVHLSTAEYEQLFDWKRVCREVRVIQPLFYVQQPDGSLKVQAVWAKSCRGAMTRFILQNRISNPAALTTFRYEGFTYLPIHGNANTLEFIRQL